MLGSAGVAPRLDLTRLVVAALFACACGNKSATLSARTPELDTAELGASYVTPASWRYHPLERAQVNAREPLGEGRTLLVGARGERWIHDTKQDTLEAAASLAPEDLVAVLRNPEGGYWFIGKSGTNYEAREPLGPFVRSSAPFDRLVKVSGAKGTLLGVRSDRRLWRSSDGGATWALAGLEGASVVDVEMTSDGQALVLGLPERLWESRDGGATFTPLAVPPQGVLSLKRDPVSGEVRAVTPLGAKRYRPGEREPLAPLAAQAKSLKEPEPPRGPDAGALAEGRAVLFGVEYLEAELADAKALSWKLWRGKLGEPLEATELPEAQGCRALRLARFGNVASMACFRRGAEKATQPVEIYRSSLPGQKFERETFTPYASLAAFKFALGVDGKLIVSGVCPASAEAAGCAPNGVHYRRPARPASSKRTKKEKAAPEEKKPASEEKKSEEKEPEIKTGEPRFELAAAATPALSDSALALAFSVDGRVAYALGRSTKSGQFVLYVSKDGGVTFEPEELDLSGMRDLDYGDGTETLGVVSMVPAEDASVAVVLSRYRSRILVVTDESGRVLSVARPPASFALMAAAGARALVIDRERQQVLESLDGGATWEAVGRLPIDLCAGDSQCDVPVLCAPEGCVIGHELTRIGWGGQRDEDLGVLSPSDVTPKEALERRVRTPIECVLAPTPFKPLPGVRAIPEAEAAMLGKTAWFAIAEHRETASATVFRAGAGPRARVETSTLLTPVSGGEAYAFTLVNQIEGAAALRYRLPNGSTRRITNVEVAWQNLFEDRVTTARLSDAGAFLAGDVDRVDNRYYSARLDLISITVGGLYLRVHATPRDRQTTYFFDGQRVVELPPIPWPESVRNKGRAEMARVGEHHLGVWLYGNGSAVVRASRHGANWTFDAGVTGLANPTAFRLMQSRDITYVNGGVALSVELDDTSGRGGVAHAYRLRAEGDVLEPPVAVPTQSDLGSLPEPCSETERAQTPRVVASYLPGTRHPILVSDAVDAPRTLLTGRAVLHGTPERPCVAAFDAEPVFFDGGTTPNEGAIFLPGDPEHAWLFRVTAAEQVEYRPMSCRFSPTAEVPAEVFRMPGTSAPRGSTGFATPRPAGE